MKILFHIGMGKTGTTSLQNALAANSVALAEQGICYLGKWFDTLGSQYKKPNGIQHIFNQRPAKQTELARQFFDVVSKVAAQDKVESFIFSNEAIFVMAKSSKPFFKELQKLLEVKFVAYLREPGSWLPSAYSQWGLRHKKDEGPIKPFRDMGDELAKMYYPVIDWHQLYGESIAFRKFDKNIDIIEDFSALAKINLKVATSKARVRDDLVESVFRAAFNSDFPKAVHPDLFTNTVYNAASKPPKNLKNFIENCFDYSSLSEIIKNNENIFKYINDDIKLELNYQNIDTPKSIKIDDLTHDIIGYLVAITLDQSKRIKKLEKMVNILQEE